MGTTGSKSRTTRVPNAYASVGAVVQANGSLPVYRCNGCGAEVVWAESKRTGRKYLVSVSYGQNRNRYYRGDNVHPRDCRERLESSERAWVDVR